MPEINITSNEQVRLFATDGLEVIEFLAGYGFQEDELIIVNALTNGGVTLHEFTQLIINATVRAASNQLDVLRGRISCNGEPLCELEMGHDGQCVVDEEPF